MNAMPQRWTDDRLDAFRTEVNDRFNVVDHRFDEVDHRFNLIDRRFEEIDRRFGEVDRRLDKVETELGDLRADMKAGFERVDERFEKLYRLIIQFGSAGLVALAGVIATLISVGGP